MKQCEYCKKDFEPSKPKQVYCSDKCRTYSYRKNNKIVVKNKVTIVKASQNITEAKKKIAVVEKELPEPKEGSLAWYLKHGNEQK